MWFTIHQDHTAANKNPGSSPDFHPIYDYINFWLCTEDQLLAICLDMFMAGSETTSKSLGFCFLYLILYPDVQKKAQQEIDTVVGRDRLPSLQDRPKLVTYLLFDRFNNLRLFINSTIQFAQFL